ncbi:RHS repeat protein, partial [Escherichia coli]
LDRLIQETGFDGRTQRYHHDLTGKLIRSEDEGLVTHWYYDEAGRLASEHLTVHHPQTNELLWQHETRHAYNAQGLANRCIPDSL